MENTNSTFDIGALNEKIERESAFVDVLSMEMNKVIIGQKHMVERLMIGLSGPGPHSFGRCSRACKNTRH